MPPPHLQNPYSHVIVLENEILLSPRLFDDYFSIIKKIVRLRRGINGDVTQFFPILLRAGKLRNHDGLLIPLLVTLLGEEKFQTFSTIYFALRIR